MPYRVTITERDEKLGGGFLVAISKGKYFPDSEPVYQHIADLIELKKVLGEIYKWPKPGRPRTSEKDMAEA